MLSPRQCWFALFVVATDAFLLASSVVAFSPSVSNRPLATTATISTRKYLISSTSPQVEGYPYERLSLVGPSARSRSFTSALKSSSSSQDDAKNTENTQEDPLFDIRTTLSLVVGQSLLIVAAIIAAALLKTPNYGLGPNIDFSSSAILQGCKCALPLFVLAYALDNIEDQFPALQDVTKATQRSVLALLGGTLKPLLAIVVSLALGVVAGFGEEMLFRGVFQYEIAQKFGTAVGVAVSSVIFGLLHAVTPLYAILATLASVFFGSLYVWSGNLAVPIITHAVYDVGALLWAHWTVVHMTSQERQELVDWKGPTSSAAEEK